MRASVNCIGKQGSRSLIQIVSVIKATALETLSEPIVLLSTMVSLVLAIGAPAMHYHQFGEASRMARDAAFSALMLGGGLIAVIAAIIANRREIERKTVIAAVVRPISRTTFFLAKTAGAALAAAVSMVSIASVSMTIIRAAVIGGAIAEAKGLVARLYGPSLVVAVCAVVLPVAIAALLNRFARFRFVQSANLLTLLIAFAGTFFQFDFRLVALILPALTLSALPSLLLLSAASAFSIRWRTGSAVAATALTALLFLPALGNYSPADMVSATACVGWSYVLPAAAALIPAVALFLFLGVLMFNRMENFD